MAGVTQNNSWGIRNETWIQVSLRQKIVCTVFKDLPKKSTICNPYSKCSNVNNAHSPQMHSRLTAGLI